ncbi:MULTISPECIES: imidazole glycerol phosphate synthase subunit HisH [unclassified Hydrogenobaculum]|uniref:imidazole glycerol phosphate synthase subunit HisH n=1 Tax=unclassified Hydrogenobaculum TaxID=2622382 RepID=UPI0001C5033D|nr:MULTISPECIES: imidazole glycerol phosphate synthase subunit HisH [unclassified Hydrogenobaculum]AEF19742.1 imidazole glycerol phosphate synthase, glutamine amidotransferase subunit [Hydrogenobaculum sp. 3684]AEG47029.1 Imidazole glycerol phosphate synthase subunit hisH [Hydrogenobaculum sp. SHO]AGG15677.1 imidazole glycerol phosphate synthase, glutamine amidotransferase subunit [Hydrogenobaculum sp. HO]AGH93976.1 imidazole glycerol phosphate synthase, glutamine amidotransferase subunit [Hydr
MIGIIDYGMGNLGSVFKAFDKVGLNPQIINTKDQIKTSDALCLPGVGAFKDAMDNLKNLDIIDDIIAFIKSGKPFIGICLGYQLLFEKSYEFGEHEGLSIFKGDVRLFPVGVKVPHIGWNQLWIKKDDGVFKGVENGAFVYFVHSYYVNPQDKDIISTYTDYSVDFASSIEYENVVGLQFHPEKSQEVGLKILSNFKEKYKL